MSTSVLKALPGKLDIKRHSPSILIILVLELRMNKEVRDLGTADVPSTDDLRARS